MAYEQRDNSGSLFVNDRKEKETHPDFKGTAMIDGVVYWVSGWRKAGQRGDFTSLSFKRKDEGTARESIPARPAPQQSISQRAMPKGPATTRGPQPSRDALKLNADMNDDIPF